MLHWCHPVSRAPLWGKRRSGGPGVGRPGGTSASTERSRKGVRIFLKVGLCSLTGRVYSSSLAAQHHNGVNNHFHLFVYVFSLLDPFFSAVPLQLLCKASHIRATASAGRSLRQRCLTLFPGTRPRVPGLWRKGQSPSGLLSLQTRDKKPAEARRGSPPRACCLCR